MKVQTRRQSRYNRRLIKRINKKINRAESVGSLRTIFQFDKVFKYGRKCCNGVRWKQSVQTFEMHLFSNTARCISKILKNTYQWSPCNHFMLNERGKYREIDAPLIKDRQAQKVITKEILTPLYLPLLIHNNGASLKGKGLTFSYKQLKADMVRHFRKYGLNGYVIVSDFSKFFPSANHNHIKQLHSDLLLNKEITKLLDSTTNITKTNVGLPLGIENSQMEMICYPYKLDNYITSQLHICGFGHYMDDYYILVPPHLDPHEIFKKFKQKALENNINVSDHKTKIVPFGHPFKYCKTQFTINKNGKIKLHGNRDTIKRAQRKLKLFAKKVLTKEMTYRDVWDSIQSVISYYRKYNDFGRIKKLHIIFRKLFGFKLKNRLQLEKKDKI